MNKIASIVGCLFLTTGIAFSGPVTLVPLKGGVVAPLQTISIPLTGTTPMVRYTMVCNINDPNNANNKVSINVTPFSFNSTVTYLEGQLITTGPAVGTNPPPSTQLLAVDSSLTLIDVINTGYEGAALQITNNDAKDQISVECAAVR